MKYCIGINIEGFERLEMDKEKLEDISGSEVVLVLDESSSGQLNKYYSGVKNILTPRKLNRLILILDGTTSTIRKQICMLCVTMENYDIYSVENIANVNKEYVELLLKRSPTESEVSTFISSDLSAYARLSQFVLKLNALATEGNAKEIESLVVENKSIIYDFPPLVDYMKCIVDTHNTGFNARVAELKLELENLNSSNKELRLSLKASEETYEKAKTSLNGLETEVREFKTKCRTLEEQLDESDSSGAYKYIPVKISKVRGINRVKCIIYFKEISPVLYINSLVKYLKESIGVLIEGEELRVKTVVYDRPGDYSAIYSPLTIVNGSKFHDNPGILDGDRDVLITEPSMGITEALLKIECDILIIYDKLKCGDDLVEGNTVTKFHVIGSSSAISKVEQARGPKLERDKIISNIGACPGTLYINHIDEFKKAGGTARLSKYYRLPCGSGLLMHMILDQCGLKVKSK